MTPEADAASPRSGMRAVASRAASFAGVTVITQILALASGLIVVRAMSKEDYALYAIATATVGASGVLADSGLNSILIASAGRARRAGRSVVPPFLAAHEVRRRMLLIVVPAFGLFTLYLLLANGGGTASSLVMVALVAATVWPEANASLYRMILQIGDRVSVIQWVTLAVAIGRLVLVVTLWMVPRSLLLPFLAVQALASVAQLILMRKHARVIMCDRPEQERDDLKPYVKALWNVLPQNIVLVASPQLITLALTLEGNSAAIAEIAALSRFGMVMVVLQQVVGNVAAPLVALSSESRRATNKALVVIVGGMTVAVAGFVVVTALASDLLLRILGPGYENLHDELVLIAIGSGLSTIAGYALGVINHARGWTSYSWVYVPLFMIWAVIALTTLDLSTSMGAVLMVASLPLVDVVTQIIRLSVGYRRLTE
ncbi:lipopolysaccharide biosynthesis protein [Demequina gelatinilytica]|uniref:lipopolysaccharide biosynthesis protein n=1 Tax=Demequina gelatinilytica TaxID=1638980 RepID=UPI0007861C90|nr:oligosaccharide flippase family protein [Demequina gelatinilytica]